MFQIFQRRFDAISDTGKFLAVNALKRDIAKVQLATTEIGTIGWSVSADNGAHWEPIVPGAGWHSFTHTGSELMWKSQHVYDFTQPDVNPTCSSLEMEWIYSHVEVGFDIKPRSCPNPFNIKWLENLDKESGSDYAIPKKGGVIPAALVGNEDFDVTEVDISTLRLEGIEPVRTAYEDVTAPVSDGDECACTVAGPDGTLDLTMKFRCLLVAELVRYHERGDEVGLTLTGSLLDGTQIEGSDCIIIVGKEPEPSMDTGSTEVTLGPASPNPFNPTTTIRFDLPRATHVKLSVYNVKGELIATLVNQHMTEGRKEVTWNAKDNKGRAVSSGIYFYRLVAGDFVQTKKMVLLR